MLRKLKFQDAELMYLCLISESVNKYLTINVGSISIESCRLFIRESQSEENKHFAIVDEQDQWVGTISLKNIDLLCKSAEYAIITSQQVHGKGYAFAATQEILKYGFNDLKLNRIYLNVVSNNIRANKFYLKCGFQLEGTFRQAIYIKGKIYDLNWYSIIK